MPSHAVTVPFFLYTLQRQQHTGSSDRPYTHTHTHTNKYTHFVSDGAVGKQHCSVFSSVSLLTCQDATSLYSRPSGNLRGQPVVCEKQQAREQKSVRLECATGQHRCAWSCAADLAKQSVANVLCERQTLRFSFALLFRQVTTNLIRAADDVVIGT
jgi:hypothetical protein